MFQTIRKKIIFLISLIWDGLLDIGARLYFKVEEFKIFFITNALEKMMNKNIALLGEMAFKTGEKKTARIMQNETILKLASYIINEQQKLTEMRIQYLKNITKK